MSNHPSSHNDHDANIESELQTRYVAPLSAAERDTMWQSIEQRIAHTNSFAPTRSVVSFIHYYRNFTRMTPLIILALIFGGSATVAAASDSARPGDALFVIDRVVENARIALSNDDDKVRLRLQFAQERIDEVRSLIDDEPNDDSSNTSTDDSTDDSNNSNDDSSNDSDDSTNTNSSDDSSQPSSTTAAALTVALDFIEQARNQSNSNQESFDALVEELNTTLGALSDTAKVKVKAKSDDRIKIETKDGNERLKIELKDGEVKIDVKVNDSSRDSSKSDDDDHDDRSGRGSDDSDDDDHDDDRGGDRSNDDSDDDNDNSSSSTNDSSSSSSNSTDDSTAGTTTTTTTARIEAEADVFTDTTVVKVEINDQKHFFDTTATTREAIAAEIAAKFSLDAAVVLSVLDVEVEDRASRGNDRD